MRTTACSERSSRMRRREVWLSLLSEHSVAVETSPVTFSDLSCSLRLVFRDACHRLACFPPRSVSRHSTHCLLLFGIFFSLFSHFF